MGPGPNMAPIHLTPPPKIGAGESTNNNLRTEAANYVAEVAEGP